MRLCARWRAAAVAIGVAHGGMAMLSGCGPRPAHPEFPAATERLLAPFQSDAPPAAAYDGLFRYFLTGFVTYRERDGAGASYPGLPSTHGARVDAMEGFTRFAPLVAVWLQSGRPTRVTLADGVDVDLVALVRDGIVHGTDPASPGYWGAIGDHDQRWCEAADVALIVWLTRAQVWDRLDARTRARVSRWLASGTHSRVSDNNWHLFSTFVPLVLDALGEPADTASARVHYRRFASFYRGEGWFSDGPENAYDFYNAWGIHYLLYWIDRVRPDWDPQFIASTRREFATGYRYMISRTGIPIRGRSICYRLSAPAPLVLEYRASRTAERRPVVSAGEARRALDAVWSWFIRQRAVAGGAVSQGYCAADARILDNYSGPASCLWSLRSLVAAFTIPPSDPFWTGQPAPLPIDRASYRYRIASVGFTLLGDRRSGVVTLVSDDSLPDAKARLREPTLLSRLGTALTGRAHRPRNSAAKYGSGTYSSMPPFCGCR